MPNDLYGRPIAVGDTVTLKGEVVKVLDDPGYINCTVKLAHPMPPSGAEVSVQCNSAQVEKQGGGEPKGDNKTEGKQDNPQPQHGAPAKK